MTRTEKREWAKEMTIEGIDQYLKKLFNDNSVVDLDSQNALVEQRNRVAKLLNLPKKTLGQIEF